MSGKVTGWVLENSAAAGATRLVLIVLADHADSEGRNAWPSVHRIAHEARCGRSTVHRALRELEAAGEIERESTERNGVVHYRIVMDTVPNRDGPKSGRVQDRDAPRPKSGPEPSFNRQGSTSLSHKGSENSNDETPSVSADVDQGSARPRARRKPVTYRGKTVPGETVQTAERLLAVFNEHTGSALGDRTGDGRPSQALKQIVGALLERDADEQTWMRGVRAMIDDPPSWIDGRWMVGYVFGPKAAEQTLARGRADAPTSSVRRNGRWTAEDMYRLAEAQQ